MASAPRRGYLSFLLLIPLSALLLLPLLLIPSPDPQSAEQSLLLRAQADALALKRVLIRSAHQIAIEAQARFAAAQAADAPLSCAAQSREVQQAVLSAWDDLLSQSSLSGLWSARRSGSEVLFWDCAHQRLRIQSGSLELACADSVCAGAAVSSLLVPLEVG